MNKTKILITPELPSTTLSIAKTTDYGSTTSVNAGSSLTTQTTTTAVTPTGHVELSDDHFQSFMQARFSKHGERATGFDYRSIGSSRKSSTQLQPEEITRFPSFVNLPNIPGGRHFRRSMEHNGGAVGVHKHGAHNLKIIEQSINVLNHVFIGFIAIYMSWLCLRTGLAGTALHAWLVTLGFVLLMAEGIMCHYKSNVLTLHYQRDMKTRIHWILQSIGGGLGMIGALIKLIQKGFLLQSIHGQLGFAAFILCIFTMLGGLSALYSMRLKTILSPLLNKSLHNLLGFATFVIAMLAQFYGYRTGFFIRKAASDMRDLMQALTILALVFTSLGPLKALLKKFHSIYHQYIKR